MNIFDNYAIRLFESGFNVIPIDPKLKRPLISGWQNFCDKKMTDQEFDRLCKGYPGANIGIPMGKANGLIAFDYDYDGPNHSYFDNIMRGILQISPLEKVGAKGFTRFYRYNGEENEAVNAFDGKRFFDLLSTGKQCVIPPSIHPSGVAYKWTALNTLEDYDRSEVDADIPILEENSLAAVRLLAALRPDQDFSELTSKRTGRHDVLLGIFINLSSQCSDFDSLVNLMIEEDARLYGSTQKGRWFLDKSFKSRDVVVNARREITAFIKWWTSTQKKAGNAWSIGRLPKSDKDKFEEYCKFFLEQLGDTRLDKVSGEWYGKRLIKKFGKWKPLLQPRNIKTLRSLALSFGLPDSPMENHLCRYAESHESRLLIDFVEWDGVDRIAVLCRALKVTNVSAECLEELFKEWCSNLLRRVDDTSIQNKFIVLKGAQNIGKDTWIENLLKYGLCNYFGQVKIEREEEKNYESVAKLLCANVPEFDRSGKASFSQLKALITSPDIVYRVKYDRLAESKDLRCSFIGSCNVDDILRDHTGNRRYIIFDLSDIDRNYPKGEYSQLIGQMKWLANSCFKASDRLVSEMDAYIAAMTPDDPETDVMNACMSMINDACKSSGGVRIEFKYVDTQLNHIARTYGLRMRQLSLMLGRKRVKAKIGGKIYLIAQSENQDEQDEPRTYLNGNVLDQVVDIKRDI